jgi:hypothetical protein
LFVLLVFAKISEMEFAPNGNRGDGAASRRAARLPPGPRGPDPIQEVCETGDISDRDTPVPIPNTAVKPVRADGTNAQLGVGRVGRRRSHKPLESNNV